MKTTRNVSIFKSTTVLSLNHMLQNPSTFFKNPLCLQCSDCNDLFCNHKMLSSIYCHGNQPRRTFLVHYFHITPAVSVFVHMKKSISLNFLHVSPQGSHVLVFSHRFYPRKYFFSVKHHFLIHLLLHTDVKTMISKPPFPLASWLCCLNIKHLL